MFVRTKSFLNNDGSQRTYLQLVASRREQGKVRQVVVATLGRLEELQKDGTLDHLVESLAKYTTKLEVLDAARDLGRLEQGTGISGGISTPMGDVGDGPASGYYQGSG